MANEEKILSMLEGIQSELQTMKDDIISLKKSINIKQEPHKPPMDELEVFRQMSQLLTKEEGDSLAAAMDEIERRKFAV